MMSGISWRELFFSDKPTVRQYLEQHYPDDVKVIARGLQPATLDDFVLIDDGIGAHNQYACSMSNGHVFSFMYRVDTDNEVVYFFAPPEWNTEWKEANDLRDKP